MTLIRDIFDIPAQVHQGDFVLRLGEGLLHPQQTLQSYVVTPQLVGCFQRAMGLIEGALKTGTSKGAYLHGSFGSGKSHFMAVLSLLLRNDPVACAVPELAEVVVAHRHWTGAGGRRLLLVPYHMVGAASMEAAVFGQYTETVRRLHPEAPLPGFFLAGDVFRDAQNLRARLGDEAFFSGLNSGGSDGDDSEGWGSIATWDAASFDDVLAMPPDLDEHSSAFQERQRLVGTLVGSYFQSVRSYSVSGEGLLPLDAGLAVMSRHAQQLGYEGVVLFLDELILWLASHAAEPSFLNREGQKVAKLVEAEHADRPVPLVSFIARQRDLRELVGEHLPGAEQLGFADVLNYWEARFDTISLDDRDLPAIAAKRLLQPRSEAARQRLEAAFAKSAGARQEVLDTLLTRAGDREMFRKVYPFSPALVQTLIALSALLQRERTALRLMLQLLVRYRDTLEVGDIVPVGDLFDVIMAGDEPFMQALRLRFEDARRLYRQKMLPMLEAEHGVSAEDVEASRVDESKRRAFINDGRLLKTLLLSALAEGVEALSGLTAARLAALNHGSVRSPIPGQEGPMVLTRLRRWAAQIGEIKIGDGNNPAISLHLTGVDTDGILANAADGDNYGNRVRRIKALLFEALGLPESEDRLLEPVFALLWRGTRRECEVLVRNVREQSNADLRPDQTDWRIVIDYPFDREGHGPQDDLNKLENFRQDVADGARTLVWLPDWLNPPGLAELGRLNLLEHALSGGNLERYGSHLSPADREAARGLLQNQRDQLRQRLRNLLQAAYGVSAAETGGIDRTHGLSGHFHALLPGLNLRPPVGRELKECLDDLFAQALDHQYPAHPVFEIELKPALLRRCWEELARAAQRPDRRIEVDRDRRDELRRVALPLHLADMNPNGSALVLRSEWHELFDRPLRQSGQRAASVRQLRQWLDQPQARGLTRPVQNLLIRLYALCTDRQFFRHGAQIDISLPEHLEDDLELRQRTLPAPAQWQTAQARAATIFGLAGAAHCTSSALDRFAVEVQSGVREHRSAVVRYQRQLGMRAQSLAVPATADRLRTAAATEALLATLAGRDAAGTVEALAQAEIASSETAMGQCLKQAARLAVLCEQPGGWSDTTLPDLPPAYRERAGTLLADLQAALAADEHVRALDTALADFRESIMQLLREVAQERNLTPPVVVPPGGNGTVLPPAPVLPPRTDVPATAPVLATGRDDVADAEALAGLLQALRKRLEAHPGARLELHWTLHARGPQS